MKSRSTPSGSDGGFAGLFVRRPILALVISALIVVGGLAALFGVEVRELPEVDNPIVSVQTNFPGAAPETIDREVTARIEGAAGRVPGVANISSSSSFGRSSVTVEFTEETNIDIAATDLKDAISRISRDLPEGIEDPRVVKSDDNAQAVMRVAITSGELSVQELTLLVEEEVVDRITAVPGVADVYVYGDRDNIFRIDVDQSKLASRGLNVGDLGAVLANAAFDSPAGSLTSSSQDIVVRAVAGIDTAAEFEAIVIKDRTRIGDVASVSLGPDPGDSVLRANGRTGVGLGIVRQAGSNTLEISASVRETVDEIATILPGDVEIEVTSDDALFIQGSINEVLFSLALAATIVIAIIYVFLLNIRATLVPAITLPVALIGAVGGIWLAGLSVNILTLLALVLATGLVVDDAIVVLENIVTQRNRGLGARAAAVVGVREVFFAVVTTTATLASVFIPISFLPGKVGALFGEFGFTLALSVALSSVVALTLCPMLASRFLATPVKQEAVPGPAARFGSALVGLYSRILRACLAAPLVVVALSVAAAVSAAILFTTIRVELTPPEDRGVILMAATAPQGVSLDFTSAQMRKVEALAEPLRQGGEVTNVFSIAGIRGGANNGFAVLTLAPWDTRKRSQQEIASEVGKLLSTVPGVRVFVIQRNSLGIRDAGAGLKLALLGDDYDQLAKAAVALQEKMEADPRFGKISLSYETTQPQLSIRIDRERAADLGISIDGLTPVIQAMLDGRSVGTVFVGDRAIDVKLISTANPINDPSDLEGIFLRASDGRIVPLSTISTLEEKAVAPSLDREQRRRAVTVTASLSPDFALGSALEEAQQLAEPLLPPGARLAPLAEAATLNSTESGMRMTFLFAIVVVLLVLAAQFESFVSALIIILTVPLGLACAVFALVMTGTSLNVYSQIGLVLLVGIMAKNGILMVEFANQLRNRGMSVAEAAEQAAIRRLRPIMMTMVSTVLGAVPLVLASGAGSEARVALGWVIAGGLGIATAATLFVTPVVYRLLAGLSAPAAIEEERLRDELRGADVA